MSSARDPESLQRLTRDHLLMAARAWDATGAVSNFKLKTPREVVIEGRSFPTKAIVALAHELAGLGLLNSTQLAGAAARRRLQALGFAVTGADDTDPAASVSWPPPTELTHDRIIAAAQAWQKQDDAFRTAHAAREWEVWIGGKAYPVKAICILVYLALGHDPKRIAVWKKGGRNSPWDKRIENDLKFEIRAKADPEEQELERYIERDDVPTEIRRDGIARLTQGAFRRDLVALRGMERCDVSGIGVAAVLRASHIHRWADCKETPAMRRDPANGLLLAAHLDALFEHGLIAFADDGRMLVSARLDAEERDRLQIWRELRLSFTPTPRQCEYLARHRERTRAARGA